MYKNFAAIAFAGCVQAQTAMNTNYTADTVTVVDSAKATLATTSATWQLSELINGSDSASVLNYSMTMKSASTWSTDTGSTDELMGCTPFTYMDETTVVTLYSCIYAYLPIATYSDNSKPVTVQMYTLATIPTFGDTQSLADQLTELITAGTATQNCQMSYDFVAADTLTSTCYEPVISIKPSASSYSTSSWTLGFNEAETFATEEDQTLFKTYFAKDLANLGVVGSVTTATGSMNINQDIFAATLVVPASGASAFAVAGATLALFAVTF